MSFKTVNFTSTQLMDLFLNGGAIGGKKIVSATDKGRILGLDGLTLIIGAETVTFVDAAGTGLTLAAIKTQIEAGTTGVTVSFYDGYLVLSAATALTVVSTGTANPVFGFSSSANTVGVLYNPPDGLAPRVLFIGASPAGDSYAVTLELA